MYLLGATAPDKSPGLLKNIFKKTTNNVLPHKKKE